VIATTNNGSSAHDNCGRITVANAINVPLSDTSGIAPYRPLVDRVAAVARLAGSAVVSFNVVCLADSDLELVAVSTAHLVAPGISLNVDRTRADRHAVSADRSKVCSMVFTAVSAVFAASDAVLAVVVVERDVPHVVPSVTVTFKEVMEVDAVAARATRRTLQ